jgi:hypothetical protein
MPGLIITNGDSAATLLREAGRRETILPWRDVLHEGPITTTDLHACSWMRVSYLAARFGLAEPEVAAEFAARDAIVRRHADFDRIELWFEHDLYDQLQLMQVLAFLAAEQRTAGVILVQADDFLGAQVPRTILRFAAKARPIAQADLDLGAAVWAELALPTPQAIARRFARQDGAHLPFLLPALRRFLEELPASANGLGRTEQVILDLIGEHGSNPSTMFPVALRMEEAAFMGDWSFFHLIEDLAFAEIPLIAGLTARDASEADPEGFREAALELTMAGDDVRKAEEDHVQLSGIDRWWAGTRLSGRDVWRYDRQAQRLVPPAESGA